MALNRDQKQEVRCRTGDFRGVAHSLVASDYAGSSRWYYHMQEGRAIPGFSKVAKNTLFSRAWTARIRDRNDDLDGPLRTPISQEPPAPRTSIKAFARRRQADPRGRGGRQAVPGHHVDVLIASDVTIAAMLLNVISQPATMLVRLLAEPASQVARVTNAAGQTKAA